MRGIAVVGAVILVGGCGYVLSGTWEDDPGNWERAFSARTPPGVTVVHSLYWRGAHWTFEAAYPFELQATPAFRSQFAEEHQLRQTSAVAADDLRRHCIDECPPWFVPKPPVSYEAWASAEPGNTMVVLIDKGTGHIFFGDSIL